MSNSAFTPSVLTIAGSAAATSGEKNYILSPDDNTSGRWVSSTSPTVTISTSTSTIPDNITKTTSLAIAWSSGTTGYARYRFTLDQADYGKKFKISWDQIYATAGHWTLEVYSNTAADYSGTSTKLIVATSAIPGITGTFTTSVDMSGSSAPYIEVRVIAASTSATTIYLNNVLVGPGQIVQGAAISEWISYTPTFSAGVGTASTINFWYRRVGSDIEIQGSFYTGTVAGSVATFTLPNNLTVGLSAVAARSSFGIWHAQPGTAGLAFTYAGVIIATALGANTIGFDYQVAASTSIFSARNGSTLFNSTSIITLHATIPVAEWASSGTVNLGPGAQVEYASNNGSGGTTANTDYNTGSVAGPFGSNFVAVAASTTGSTGYKVTFQYLIQQDETIVIEVSGNSGVNWSHYSTVALTDRFYLGGVQYGMWVDPIDSTSVYVRFGNGGRYTTNTSIGNTGAPWSDLTSTYRWRIRKAKASAPVGFGLAGTDGSAGLVSPYSTSGIVSSGTYTPNITASSGFTIGTIYAASYMRVGSVVTVSGCFKAALGAAANNVATITLPVARTTGTTLTNGGGTAVYARGSVAPVPISIYANGSTTTFEMFAYTASSVVSDTVSYCFTYSLA